MDPWVIITGAAVIVGIAAGTVQVLEYLDKRRERTRRVKQPPVAPGGSDASAATAAGAVIPGNLPPGREFIGREAEKRQALAALASRYPLTYIDGIGGIGKTALALEVAGLSLHASRDPVSGGDAPTFDGYIWTSAKDRELALADVLDTIARTLDYPGIAQQPPDEKLASVRKLLQEKRYLVIVDNFDTVTDPALAQFLIDLPEPSKGLVTSREQKLLPARTVSLKGLQEAEALELIRSEGERLDLPAVEWADEATLLRLYRATGGAPLAIKWAVGQIKQRGQSLDTVLAALHQARGDIFADVFARSWALLSPEATRILLAMPLFAAPAGRAGIEAAAGVHHFALDEGLGQLAEMWLLEAGGGLADADRTYTIHPLTRAFAEARLREDPPGERALRLRLARYYQERVRAQGEWGKNAGFPWFEAELENILAALEWCHEAGEWSIVVDLMHGLAYFMGTRGYWQQRIEYSPLAVEAAQHLQDGDAVAWFNLNLAWIYRKQGNYGRARECAETARDLTGDRDPARYRIALRQLANIALAEGDVAGAELLTEEVLDLARAAGDEGMIYSAQHDLGSVALARGDYESAEKLYQEALRGFDRLGDQEHAAARRIDLGNVLLLRERPDEARRHFAAGLALSQVVGREDNIAFAHYGLARALAESGDHGSETLEHALAANAIFERLAMEKQGEETGELCARLQRVRES